MNEIEKLRARVETLNYPSSITKINGEIKGCGFFPGANGTFDSSTNISDKSVMILGQDQDSERGFNISTKKGNEDYSSTWRNLKPLLSQSGIELNDCFFTNCLMGIRAGSVQNTGKSPGLKHPDFVVECLDLLRTTIDMQKPKLIICLGIVPTKLLMGLTKRLYLKFIALDTFEDIDNAGLGLLKQVEFDGLEGNSVNIAVLLHPSYRVLNKKIRKFQNLQDEDVEVEILKQAYS